MQVRSGLPNAMEIPTTRRTPPPALHITTYDVTNGHRPTPRRTLHRPSSHRAHRNSQRWCQKMGDERRSV